MTDYENDLAFKPAMTWEELCEYAKSKGAEIIRDDLKINKLYFEKNGDIIVYRYGEPFFFAKHRTYEQMKNIIDNLYGED